MARIVGNLISAVFIQLIVTILVEVSGFKLSFDSGEILDGTVADSIINGSEVEATSITFQLNNVTLNCLGLPIKLYANEIDSLLVDKTKAEDVRFYFSSRSKPDFVTVYLGDKFSLKGTDYDISRDTVLMVHGFLNSGEAEWLRDMKNAYLKYVCIFFNSVFYSFTFMNKSNHLPDKCIIK